MNTGLAAELLAMASEDARVRGELAADGSLSEGYQPRMRAVHERNARRLEAMIEECGWPASELVGIEAAQAAWLVVQHAISRPGLMRRALRLLREPANAGAVSLSQIAMLDERIRVMEGRRQLYGTQFDWDVAGEMSPLPVDDAAQVDERRAAVGLPPLALSMAEHRSRGEKPPEDLAAHRRHGEAFAREVGWR